MSMQFTTNHQYTIYNNNTIHNINTNTNTKNHHLKNHTPTSQTGNSKRQPGSPLQDGAPVEVLFAFWLKDTHAPILLPYL